MTRLYRAAAPRRSAWLACVAVAFAAVCAAAATPAPPPDDGAGVLVDALMAALDAAADETPAAWAH